MFVLIVAHHMCGAGAVPTRTLQDQLKMTLRFSLWFPDFNREGLSLAVLSGDETDLIRQDVLQVVAQIICEEGEISIQNQNGQDICRSPETETYPSVLESSPEVIVRERSQDDVVFTTWIVRYLVDQVGDVFVNEALQNEPGDISEEAFVQAMQQSLQIALDVRIMERSFDALLKEAFADNSRNPIRAYSSPIRKESETFGRIQNDLLVINTYTMKKWSAMRITGIVMAFIILVFTSVLNRLAMRRRKLLRKEEKMRRLTLEHDEPVHTMLSSPKSVETMLELSSNTIEIEAQRMAEGRYRRHRHRSLSRPRRMRSRSRSMARSIINEDEEEDVNDTVAVAINGNGNVEGFVARSPRSFDSDDASQNGGLQLPNALKLSRIGWGRS